MAHQRSHSNIVVYILLVMLVGCGYMSPFTRRNPLGPAISAKSTSATIVANNSTTEAYLDANTKYEEVSDLSDEKRAPVSVTLAPTSSPTASPQSSRPSKPLYSMLRKDRSGAALMDVLWAYSFCRRHNLSYAGTCGTSKHVEAHQRALAALGWDRLFKIHGEKTCRRHNTMNPIVYREKNTAAFTLPFRQHLIEHTFGLVDNTFATEYRIMAHIRRGDVHICSPNPTIRKRYIPNRYYQFLMNETEREVMGNSTTARNVTVTIYSEENSLETWDTFRQQGYDLRLDGDDLAAIWKSMAGADALLLSKSSFSFVGALLNIRPRTTVWYMPFKLHPLEEWRVVPRELLDEAEVWADELYVACNMSDARGFLVDRGMKQ